MKNFPFSNPIYYWNEARQREIGRFYILLFYQGTILFAFLEQSNTAKE